MSSKAPHPYEIKIKSNPILEIPQGKLEGVILTSREGKDYAAFYGIPFAKCPKRFESPEKWENWKGTLNATKARDRCPQVSLITRRVFGSENCLYLNIFTPKIPSPHPQDERCKNSEKNKKLDVMVFIFGGGFAVGGGDLYGGKYLVDQDVIVVTFNYELLVTMSQFYPSPTIIMKTAVIFKGFLGDSGDGQVKANNGLKDQVLALKWVKEHIKYFGGGGTVTLAGESAGAGCVHLHTMSNMSKGLFQRAIMQSGNALAPWAFTRNPEEKVKELVKKLELDCDLNDMSQMVQALKEVHPFALAAQRINFTDWEEQSLIHFAPSIESEDHNDATFLTQEPLEILKSGKIANQVPIIMGINAYEGAYRAIPLLQNPTRLKAINEDWESIASPILFYNHTKSQNQSQLLSSIRKFYFGENPIGWDTKYRLIDMISDAAFIHSMKVTASYHSSLHRPENPIFLYIFDYKGEFSYLNSFGVFENYGITSTHADELQYILNQRIFFSKILKDSKDYDMIGKMSECWGNFIKTGAPKFSNVDSCWEPLTCQSLSSERRYYKISNDSCCMIDEPFKSRMVFWDSLYETC